MSDVADFLPNYPKLSDPQLQYEIANKKEFYDLKLKPVEPTPQSGEYFNFQTLLARILSPHTPLTKMIFYLEPGVGKTCATIAVHELQKRFYVVDNPAINFNRTLILAKGRILLENYKYEFLNVCPGRSAFGNLDQKQVNRLVKKNFEFQTIQHFVNKIVSKSSVKSLREKYSNRCIFIDEGQDLKKQSSSASRSRTNLYTAMKKFFDAVENVTIVIMTGTPIIEEAYEPIALVNLLTPPQDRLPLQNKFYKEFYSGNKFIPSKTKKLQEFFRGKISYIKNMGSVPNKVYVTSGLENEEWLEEIDIYACKMSDHQSDIYNKSLQRKTVMKVSERIVHQVGGKEFVETRTKRDKEGNVIVKETPKGGSFYQYSKEASMFVYPDGTYGRDGFVKHIVKKRTIKRGDKSVQKISYKIPPQWRNLFIEDLQKYSCKYATTVNLILTNPTKCFYVYSDLVNNSGLILFGLILELFGFKQQRRAIGNNTPKGKRYMSLSSINITSKNQANQMIKSFGSAKNVTGEYTQVMLGSGIVSIGVTIKNLSYVVILTPQWNWPSVHQITSRGVRPGSDEHLKAIGLPTDVNVYLLTSIKNSKDVTTDVLMYQLAEEKKIRNEPILQIAKVSSVICPLAYKRNVTKASDNYECAEMEPTSKKGIYKYDIPTEDIETSNYNLYYSSEDIKEIIQEIKDYFATFFILDIDEYLQQTQYDLQLALLAIEKMIDERIQVTNKFGMICYVKEHNDMLYLQNEITDDDDAREIYYVETPTLPYNTTIDEIIEIHSFKIDEKYRKIFCETEDVDVAISAFKKMNIRSQIICFESCYNYLNSGAAHSSSKVKADAVLDLLDTKYYLIDGEIYHNLYSEKITGTSYLQFFKGDRTMRKYDKVDGWVFVSADEEGTINKKIKEIQTKSMADRLENNPYEMYGKVDTNDGKFKLVFKTGKGKRANKGRICTLFDIETLFNVLIKLNSFPEPSDDIKELTRSELIDSLLNQSKFTDREIRKNLKKKQGQQGYISTLTLQKYLMSMLIKIDNLCEFIKGVMEEKDILYED